MLSTRPARLHSVPPALSRGYQVPLALALIGSGLLARHLLARVRRIEVESFEEREEERRQRRIHETPRALLGVDFGSSEVRFATPIVETDQYGLDTVKRVRVLESKSGRHASPAYVAVDEEGAMLVGVAAKTHSLVHGGGSSVFALPSLVGRTSLPSDELSALQRSGVDIDQGPPLRVRLRGKPFAPESLFRVVLKEQKAAAAALLGAKALDGALTVAAVPPSFDDAQRVAITAAYAHAGLHVAALLDTPIAAARTYSHTRAGTDRSGGETLLVYDAGVRPSAAVVQRTRADEWEIVAHVVSSPLAAHAPDRLLAASAAAAFQKETGVDVMADPLARARFLEAVEQARIDLSTSKQTTINLPYIAVRVMLG